MEILALLIIALVAVIGIAAAVNFFWRTGPKRASLAAAFFVAVVLIFWLSGLWEGTTPRSFGSILPLFALILAAVWLFAILAAKLISHYTKPGKSDDKPDI